MQLKSLDIEREPSVVSIIIWDLDTVFSRGSDQDPITRQLGSATLTQQSAQIRQACAPLLGFVTNATSRCFICT